MTALKTLTTLAAACCAFAACRQAPTCTGTPCGTAVIVTAADAGILFPPLAGSDMDLAVGDLIFLKLADLGPAHNTLGDAGFIPRLASSWTFPDSVTIAFQIDPRAQWQDGVPVTAQDVAFTFQMYRDTQVNAPARPLLDAIASVTATDEHTAVFKFRRPYVEQFYDATFHMRIVPRHLLDSIPRARLASHALARAPIGDGWYRFVSWKAGASIELAADTTVFLGRPGLARIIWKISPDPNTAISQLIADEADAIQYLGPVENADRVKDVPQLRIVEYPSISYTFVDLNLRDPAHPSSPHPLFGNRDLRRALFQAVDRRTVVEAAYGGHAQVATGPASALQELGRDTSLSMLAFDTVSARATLAKLGWRDSDGDGVLDRAGRKLEFELLVPISSQARRRAAAIMQAQLKRVGIVMTTNEIDFNVFLDRTQKSRFHAALTNWNEDPTPSGIQQAWITKAIGGSNYRSYSNPEFDRLVREAVGARDPVVARRHWRDAYAIINQDAPGIWLAAPNQITAVHRRFENVSFPPEQWASSLWAWRVSPGKAIPRDLAGTGTAAR